MNTNPAPEITAAYVSRYGNVIVSVEPYVVHDGTRPVLVSEFIGDSGDRGDYLVGRGTIVKKDGSVGVRTILLGSGRTPAAVSARARALFA